MTKRNIRDMAASVRARLRANARETGRPLQEVLQYFAMERFLFRLSVSPYANQLVLKGGLLLTAWRAPATRPTKDIDFLARLPNDVDSVIKIVKDICAQDVEPDGLVFDANSVKGQVIKEDADYEGVRVTFLGHLQRARLNMQVDMGFGDVVVPEAAMLEYPTILGHAAPKLKGYSRETTVAEKFEAMVKLGQINSRIRDFFDVWLLLRQFDFEGPMLARAIRETFANRGTILIPLPLALTAEFAADRSKILQWTGFLRKSRIDFAPATLQQVIDAIADFILPVVSAITSGKDFTSCWIAPGPWA